MGDYPLTFNPVELGYRRQMTHHLTFFGGQDPTMHLARQQMAL
jgi:hypothetical protein